ncbi:hypothetical protein RFI_28702, partial [Reticulomyxa filosa]
MCQDRIEDSKCDTKVVQEDKVNEKKVEYVKVASVNSTENTVNFSLEVPKIILHICFNVVNCKKKKKKKFFCCWRWKHLPLKQGDEIKCTYMLNDEAKIVVESIEWLEYEANIMVDKGTFFTLVNLYTENKEQKKVTFSNNSIPGVTELHKGDKISFRLQFTNNSCNPVNVRVIEKAAMYTTIYICILLLINKYLISYKHYCLHLDSRRIKDIPTLQEIEEKASSCCSIKEWLRDPSQEIVRRGQDNNSSTSNTENNISWQKRCIQLELAKEIIVQCTHEQCRVPDTLLHALSWSGQVQDAKEDENEDVTKLLKLVGTFHEMNEGDNFEQLCQICMDIALQAKTTECITQSGVIVLNECANDNASKIVRIYVYDPEFEPMGSEKPTVHFQEGHTPKFLKKNKNKPFSGSWQMKSANNTNSSLFVLDFQVRELTSLSFKNRSARKHVEIDTQRCAYFVELKTQSHWNKLISFNNYNANKSPNTSVIFHLIENIRDEQSFLFARQAVRDMAKELPTPITNLETYFQGAGSRLVKGNIKSFEAILNIYAFFF